MMRFAILNEAGEVVNIAVAASLDELPAGAVQAGADVGKGHRLVNGQFVAPATPAPLPVADLKPDAMDQARQAAATALRVGTGGRPPEEVATWAAKQAAVEAWRSGALVNPVTAIQQAQKTVLEAEAARDGVTAEDVVSFIEGRAVAFFSLTSNIEAVRDAALKAIEAATTSAEIDTALLTLDASLAAILTAIGK